MKLPISTRLLHAFCVVIRFRGALFEKVKSDKYLPEYNNAVGVLALLKGDYEQAEKHLRTAVKLGVAIAEENLKELAEKKANAIEIESRRGNR